MLSNAIEHINGREFNKKIIFVKAWNEWAESNYLEPDQVQNRSYLEDMAKNIFQ